MALISVSQNYVQKVDVQWMKNGVWQTNTVGSGGEVTISPDYGSSVNVRPYRTSDSPQPVKFFVTDPFNNRYYEQKSSADSYLFRNCVGPHDSKVRAGVGETMLGSVAIEVKWSKPALPDLRIERIRVNNRNYSSGLSFQVGQTVRIRCDVWNAGNKDASQNHLGFYMKSSANNTTGSPIRSFMLPGTLADKFGAGKIYGTEFEYTFTSNDIGTRYMVFEADYLNVVDESDENNNVASFGPFQVVSPPNASVIPGSQSFGSVHVNECSDEQIIQLSNNGSSSISGQIRLDDGSHFRITSGGGSFSLGVGGTRSISVKFCPESAGNKADMLRVFVDGMPSHIAQANLSGSASTPPESFYGISDEFVFDTRGPMVNTGGIFLKVIETAGTNIVKKVGYRYSYIMASAGHRDPTERFDVDDNGFVFLSAPPIPIDGVSDVDDFHNEILLFNANDRLVGHMPFSYSFRNEGMHSRHAVLFFHNDEEICIDAETGAVHFPYHPGSPNNPPGRDYNYYQYGEYPVSMLIPPHFQANEQASFPQGYRFPPTDDNVKLLLFVHGLTGTFSYQDNFGANPDLTESLGDQVSYWHGTERKVNHKTDHAGNRKYHAWQFYYPNEDDLRHCAMTLRKAVDYLKTYYSLYDVYPPNRRFGIIAHSMGGLVTFEYLTTNTRAHNQTWFDKVLISQTPSHGSRAANNQYLTFKGYLGEWFGQDREAPCYRDMSIGSDFIRNLHGRDWKNLLDFNNSGTLNDNVFVLMGLTDKDYRIADWGDWWKPIYSFNDAHLEAEDHDDGVVSFSSASLLSKGIGFAGFMGNHDDGKFNAITHDGLMPGLINAYFNSSSLSGFAEYCIQHEPLVKVFVDGDEKIVIPQNQNEISINDLSIEINKVDLAKGMITFSSNKLDELNYPIFWNERQNKYVIQKGTGHSNLKSLGFLMKNQHAQKQSIYYYMGRQISRGVGFVFPTDIANVIYYPASGDPISVGKIEKHYLKHQFISLDRTTKDDSDREELTPTKTLVYNHDQSFPASSLHVDNQTTSAEFVLYSQTYDEDEVPYALQLRSPNGMVMDSTTAGITYQHDPLTSVKRIIVNSPQVGEWGVSAFFESTDGYSPRFITLAKLESDIRAKSLVDQLGHDIQMPITMEAFIEGPDPGLFDLSSIHAYFILYDEAGKTDTLEISQVNQKDKGIALSYSFNAPNPGIFNYTLLVAGIYENERFERAVYGDFLVEDLMASINIPDQQMTSANRYVDLKFTNYLVCRLCDYDQIAFEVGIENSSFADDHVFYSFSADNGLLSIKVAEEATHSYMTFYVNVLSADSLIATTNFRLSYTAADVPANLAASDITRSDASLYWIPGSTEQKWEILYGITGFDSTNEGMLIRNVTEIPHKLEGLEPGTGYDFYVRAVFDGDGNHSAWSWPGFFITNYTVMVSGGQNGTVSPEGTHDVQAGSDLYIMFTPDEGYHVEDVLIDGESIGPVSSYLLDNILSNQSVYVSFAINMYSINVTTIPEEGGIILEGGGLFTADKHYSHGEQVLLSASPNKDYVFKSWTEGPAALSDEQNYSFIALRNRNLVALFSATTGVVEINKANVMVYPNPAQTRLNVVTTNDSNMKLVRVFDLLGQEIFRRESINDKQIQIDVSNFSGGIYIVQVLTDQGASQLKFQVSER